MSCCHAMFQYEIAKNDSDLKTPNFYSVFERIIAKKKIELLTKYWVTDDLFYSLIRIREIECAS